jgi:Domain of unknown function (DUF4249)
LFALCTCIDPYFQKMAAYQSLLVVDGLITDENSSCSVRLSKTLQDQDAAPLMVKDAIVFITDDGGNTSYLTGRGDGVYRTDSTSFRGEVGRKYVLHINTSDGQSYQSDECMMHDVPDIDSVYFEKDQELVSNGSVTLDGIRIYLDSKAGDEDTYYRWEYDETWEFKVPDPSRFKYISEHNIVAASDYKEFCWKSAKSDNILIHSNLKGAGGPVMRQPLLFVASDKSDRLLIQYSLLVKQYSISDTEYDFWNNLIHVSESGSDIFAAQPYTVKGNIHNPGNPDDLVLGYFQVASVKTRRLNISIRDISPLELPLYHYPCERVETCPTDPLWNMYDPPLTFDQLYERYTSFNYIFIEPRYIPGTLELDKIIFVLNPECNNCELTGTLHKPDFWVDSD